MKFSTRNVLEGKVTEVGLGTVNTEVGLELAGGVTLHAVITKASVQGMGLKTGDGDGDGPVQGFKCHSRSQGIINNDISI